MTQLKLAQLLFNLRSRESSNLRTRSRNQVEAVSPIGAVALGLLRARAESKLFRPSVKLGGLGTFA